MLLRSFALLPLVVASPALAQPAEPPRSDALERDMATLALVVAALPDYEGSNDRSWAVAPGARVRVSGVTFTLLGNRGWADLVPDRGPGWDLQLGPLVNLDLNRSRKARDARVAALGKVRPAAEAGALIGLGYQGLITSDYDKLNLTIGVVHDLGSVHRSYVVTPTLDYSTPLSRYALVDFSLSADYAGAGYARTYFGVTPAGAAASGLPAFTPRAGWKDWSVSALGDVALGGDLTKGLQLIAGGFYRRLIGDAGRSPVTRIAGSPDQWTGALGLAITF